MQGKTTERTEKTPLLAGRSTTPVTAGSVQNLTTEKPNYPARFKEADEKIKSASFKNLSNTDKANTFYDRGVALQKLGVTQCAIHDFTQAIALGLRSTKVYALRAVSHSKQKNFTEAIDDYTQVLTLDPKCMRAYVMRALAYYKQGNFGETIADCTEALKLDHKSETAYTYRAFAYYKQKDFVRAAEDFTAAIALNKNSASLYSNLAAVNNEQGKFDLAIANCKRAIALNPNLANAYKHRSIAFAALGKETDAATDKEKALKLGATFDEVAKKKPEIKKSKSQEQILARGSQRKGQNNNNATYLVRLPG